MGRRFFSKPEDVEDYVQEVFLRVFEKLDTFSGSGGEGASSFAGWLYTLAYRHAVNTLRAHRRIREDFFADIVTSAPQDTEEELFRADTIGRVRAVLEKLPGLYTLLIRLKYYEGFTFSRISEITGLPVGTLKSHLHRCRKLLKRSMQGME